MDFSLSDEQLALQDTVARFAAAELPDVAAYCEKNHEPLPHERVKQFADMGFLGLNLPEVYGGGGQSHLDAVIVLEELAKTLRQALAHI